MTPVYNPGSPAGRLEDTLRELIAEAVAERAALVDRQELADINRLVGIYPAADEYVLQQQFLAHRDTGDLTGDFDRFVHLPLVRTTSPVMYPVITFAYNWPRQVLRLRVALFYSVQSYGPRPRLRAFGVRFETPECWDDDDADDEAPDDPAGDHDMFHAQPVRRLHHGHPRTELPGLRWLNAKQPSIPVSACDLSGLLLAMLVSVYGRRRIFERYQAGKLQALLKAASQVSGLPSPPARA